MAEPFVGEINFFPYGKAPRGWVECDGRVLPIVQNEALYSLIGNTFGGSGSTFAIPDLRGRAPMHASADIRQGTKLGVERVALTAAQMPQHIHTVNATKASGSVDDFKDAVVAATSTGEAKLYASSNQLRYLNSRTVSPAGESQPHPNCQPSLVGTYCIATSGIFPSRG